MAIRKHKIARRCALALSLVYLSGPLIAGAFGIGDRAGPKLYPQVLHEPLYELGWSFTSFHEDGSPRISGMFESKHRPWFYGMKSKNDDPEWIKARWADYRARHAADRSTTR